MSIDTTLTVLTVVGGVAGLLSLRDTQVGRVALEIEARHGTPAYKALPTHEAMLLMPRYWHLWTVRQWEKWVGVQ